MSEMVERVMLALSDAGLDDVREEDARAAIEAMREPTETVLRAGVDAFFVWDDSDEYDAIQHLARPMWNAMVDAALAKP